MMKPDLFSLKKMKLISKNKRAYFDYEIEKTYEA